MEVFKNSRIDTCKITNESSTKTLPSLKQLKWWEDGDLFKKVKFVGISPLIRDYKSGPYIMFQPNTPSVLNADSQTGKEYPKPVQYKKLRNTGICRSPLEEQVYEELNQNPRVQAFWIENIHIPYTYQNKSHTSLPDIEVHYKDGTKEIIEVKLSADMSLSKNQAKFQAAELYAKERGYHFIVRGYKNYISSDIKQEFLKYQPSNKEEFNKRTNVLHSTSTSSPYQESSGSNRYMSDSRTTNNRTPEEKDNFFSQYWFIILIVGIIIISIFNEK
jgi:hypothetical protein